MALCLNTRLGKLGVAVIYRSQNLTKAQDESILFAIRDFCQSNNVAEVLVVADLNMSETNWVNGSVKGPVDSINGSIIMQNNYLDVFIGLGLSWNITDGVTRRRMVVLGSSG